MGSLEDSVERILQEANADLDFARSLYLGEEKGPVDGAKMRWPLGELQPRATSNSGMGEERNKPIQKQTKNGLFTRGSAQLSRRDREIDSTNRSSRPFLREQRGVDSRRREGREEDGFSFVRNPSLKSSLRQLTLNRVRGYTPQIAEKLIDGILEDIAIELNLMEEANDSSLAAAAEGRAMAAVTAFSDSLLGTSARLERPQWLWKEDSSAMAMDDDGTVYQTPIQLKSRATKEALASAAFSARAFSGGFPLPSFTDASVQAQTSIDDGLPSIRRDQLTGCSDDVSLPIEKVSDQKKRRKTVGFERQPETSIRVFVPTTGEQIARSRRMQPVDKSTASSSLAISRQTELSERADGRVDERDLRDGKEHISRLLRSVYGLETPVNSLPASAAVLRAAAVFHLSRSWHHWWKYIRYRRHKKNIAYQADYFFCCQKLAAALHWWRTVKRAKTTLRRMGESKKRRRNNEVLVFFAERWKNYLEYRRTKKDKVSLADDHFKTVSCFTSIVVWRQKVTEKQAQRTKLGIARRNRQRRTLHELVYLLGEKQLQREQKRIAMTHLRQGVLFSSFKRLKDEWKTGIAVQRLRHLSQSRDKGRLLRRWRAFRVEARKRREYYAALDAFWRKSAVLSAVRIWKKAMLADRRHRRKVQQIDSFMRENRLFAILQRWREALRLRRSSKNITRRGALRVLAFCVDCWVERVKAWRRSRRKAALAERHFLRRTVLLWEMAMETQRRKKSRVERATSLGYQKALKRAVSLWSMLSNERKLQRALILLADSHFLFHLWRRFVDGFDRLKAEKFSAEEKQRKEDELRRLRALQIASRQTAEALRQKRRQELRLRMDRERRRAMALADAIEARIRQEYQERLLAAETEEGDYYPETSLLYTRRPREQVVVRQRSRRSEAQYRSTTLDELRSRLQTALSSAAENTFARVFGSVAAMETDLGRLAVAMKSALDAVKRSRERETETREREGQVLRVALTRLAGETLKNVNDRAERQGQRIETATGKILQLAKNLVQRGQVSLGDLDAASDQLDHIQDAEEEGNEREGTVQIANKELGEAGRQRVQFVSSYVFLQKLVHEIIESALDHVESEAEGSQMDVTEERRLLSREFATTREPERFEIRSEASLPIEHIVTVLEQGLPLIKFHDKPFGSRLGRGLVYYQARIGRLEGLCLSWVPQKRRQQVERKREKSAVSEKGARLPSKSTKSEKTESEVHGEKAAAGSESQVERAKHRHGFGPRPKSTMEMKISWIVERLTPHRSIHFHLVHAIIVGPVSVTCRTIVSSKLFFSERAAKKSRRALSALSERERHSRAAGDVGTASIQQNVSSAAESDRLQTEGALTSASPLFSEQEKVDEQTRRNRYRESFRSGRHFFESWAHARSEQLRAISTETPTASAQTKEEQQRNEEAAVIAASPAEWEAGEQWTPRPWLCFSLFSGSIRRGNENGCVSYDFAARDETELVLWVMGLQHNIAAYPGTKLRTFYTLKSIRQRIVWWKWRFFCELVVFDLLKKREKRFRKLAKRSEREQRARKKLIARLVDEEGITPRSMEVREEGKTLIHTRTTEGTELATLGEAEELSETGATKAGTQTEGSRCVISPRVSTRPEDTTIEKGGIEPVERGVSTTVEQKELAVEAEGMCLKSAEEEEQGESERGKVEQKEKRDTAIDTTEETSEEEESVGERFVSNRSAENSERDISHIEQPVTPPARAQVVFVGPRSSIDSPLQAARQETEELRSSLKTEIEKAEPAVQGDVAVHMGVEQQVFREEKKLNERGAKRPQMLELPSIEAESSELEAAKQRMRKLSEGLLRDLPVRRVGSMKGLGSLEGSERTGSERLRPGDAEKSRSEGHRERKKLSFKERAKQFFSRFRKGGSDRERESSSEREASLAIRQELRAVKSEGQVPAISPASRRKRKEKRKKALAERMKASKEGPDLHGMMEEHRDRQRKQSPRRGRMSEDSEPLALRSSGDTSRKTSLSERSDADGNTVLETVMEEEEGTDVSTRGRSDRRGNGIGGHESAGESWRDESEEEDVPPEDREVIADVVPFTEESDSMADSSRRHGDAGRDVMAFQDSRQKQVKTVKEEDEKKKEEEAGSTDSDSWFEPSPVPAWSPVSRKSATSDVSGSASRFESHRNLRQTEGLSSPAFSRSTRETPVDEDLSVRELSSDNWSDPEEP